LARLSRHQQQLLRQIDDEALSRNVPLYTKLVPAASIPEGVLGQLDSKVKLVLMGWPGPLEGQSLAQNPVNVVLQNAHAHVAVLLDRGLGDVRRILVPVGGGPHSRLAIQLASEIAEQERAELVALRCFCEDPDVEDLEDQMLALREIIEDELGSVPPQMVTRLSHAGSVAAGILEETARQSYDLIVVGASEEWADSDHLFGTVDDKIAQQAPTSVLMVKRYESAMISWIRRQTKRQDSNGDLTSKSDKNK
jgi:nucleotide-binding universal stress UspA family protein